MIDEKTLTSIRLAAAMRACWKDYPLRIFLLASTALTDPGRFVHG